MPERRAPIARALPSTVAALDAAGEAGRSITLWWRDDDATVPTCALDRLLDLRRTAAVPLSLAVVPHGAAAALADRLAIETDIAVLQHGLAHRNHAPAGEKRAEFGADRPMDVMLAEIEAGRRHMEAVFGGRFRPVFVPPWNRIAPELACRLGEAGLAGLSVFAAEAPGGTAPLNSHVDLMDWHPSGGGGPSGLPLDTVDSLIATEIDRRRTGERHGPIGLLTHHLQHDEIAWATTRDLLAGLSALEAVRWPAAECLFAPPYALVMARPI